jgi:phosphate/sulfate permease
MNHQDYQKWIFSPDDLDESQRAALKDHLLECHECADLAEALERVSQLISFSAEDGPTPGFTQRWQTRQAHQRLRQQRRTTWIILLVICLAAITTAVALGLSDLTSPVSMLASVLYAISVTVSTLDDMREIFVNLFRVIPVVIPVLLWIVASMSLFFWCSVWAIGVWRLPKMRRSQNEA